MRLIVIHLSLLSLRFNSISGPLPSEIGSMSSLTILLLGTNKIFVRDSQYEKYTFQANVDIFLNHFDRLR
jgi:hypothetical protein